MTSFNELGLVEPIARALSEERYVTPTPIQLQTIPQVLAGRDVVGIAQTGTGKTAAFALPILQRLASTHPHLERRSCRALVLSPTRELSAQIADSFKTYGRHLRPRVALAIGGVPINRQVRALNGGVDILVATPGRLLDLVRMGAARLDRIDVFVLDEADRMLDMGFIHDIRAIVAKLPIKRQTLFFSATMPKEIADLAGHLLRDPVQVSVTPQATTVERITQRVVHIDRAGKATKLAELLRSEPIDRALVFTRTKHGADKLVRILIKSGLAAEAIHGNKSQGQRERVLAAFRAGKVRTLIATDIAARGIDVDGISHVFNYDLPHVPESYVHRIGRTARAGADGVAISFCEGEERPLLRAIEKLIRIAIPATGNAGPNDKQHAAHGEKRDDRNGRRSQRRVKHRNKSHQQQHRNGAPRQEQRTRNGSAAAPRPTHAGQSDIADVGFMRPKHVASRRGDDRRVPR